MMFRQVSWIPGLVTLVLFASAAAELPALNCSVTELPNGSFRYRLSGAGGSPDCSTCWEDRDRNVIARDSVFNRTIVQNLTDEFIDLKTCQNHLRHRTECLWIERDVDCRVNCSFFDVDGFPPNTKLCLSRSWCLDPETGGLVVGVPAAAVVLALVVSCVVFRRRNAVSYAPTAQMEMDSENLQLKHPRSESP